MVGDDGRHSARSGDHAPYTKGNFEFERIVRCWRGIHTVLDLRLKK
jgi:hypothetical protein